MASAKRPAPGTPARAIYDMLVKAHQKTGFERDAIELSAEAEAVLRAIPGVPTDATAWLRSHLTQRANKLLSPIDQVVLRVGLNLDPPAVLEDIRDYWSGVQPSRLPGASTALPDRELLLKRKYGVSKEAILNSLQREAVHLAERIGEEQGSAITSLTSDSELYIGLVRSIGTQTKPLIKLLERAFGNAQFGVSTIALGSELSAVESALQLSSPAPNEPKWEYYRRRMDAGDRAREVQHGMVAALALRRVRSLRPSTSHANQGGHVYVFDSLMHEAEVDVLRQAYGEAFVLLSLHEPEVIRRDNLRRVFEDDYRRRARRQNLPADVQHTIENVVSDLLSRDDGTTRTRKTQLSMQEVFHLSDYALTVKHSANDESARQQLAEQVDRLIRCLFSDPFIVPTPDETGFAHAAIASLSTTTLGRRVGASIVDLAGCVIGTGVNEVPRPGGGLYQEPVADGVDYRDHRFVRDRNRREDSPPPPERAGLDSNTDIKSELVGELLETIAEELGVSLDQLRGRGLESRLATDITEYGRTVHAEMAALLMALRAGTPVVGSTLYCTTLPCHQCARHIISAGVTRVVYSEPYPKSRLWELHPDGLRDVARYGAKSQISTDRRVDFEPFRGVSPSKLSKFMSWVERKVSQKPSDDKEAIDPQVAPGRAVTWDLREGPFRVREGFLPTEADMRNLFLGSVVSRERTLIDKFLKAARLSNVDLGSTDLG